MGHNNSKFQYFIPITPELKQESSIYRNPLVKDTLIQKPDPQVNTLQDALLRSFKTYPDREFLGLWNEKQSKYSFKLYKQIQQLVRNLGSAIVSLELAVQTYQQQLHQTLNLVGVYYRNEAEWVILDLASILFNITLVPIHWNCKIEHLEQILKESEITTIFCGIQDVSYLRTLDFTNLKTIICFDQNISQQFYRELHDSTINVYTLKGLISKGNLINDIKFSKISPDHIYTLIYTMDNEGNPVAAMISHRNICASLASIWHSETLHPQEDDVFYSYMPISHIFERLSVISAWYVGAKIGFPSKGINSFSIDLLHLQPTVLLGVPIIYTKIYNKSKEILEGQTGFDQWMYDHAMVQKNDNLLHQKGDFEHLIYDKFVFKDIKESLGGQLRIAICGGAPIYHHILEYLKIVLAIPVVEVYGLSETAGPAMITNILDSHSGHIGGPVLGVEFQIKYSRIHHDEEIIKQGPKNIQIDNNEQYNKGELMIRGSSVFQGYFKNPELTQRVLDSTGWFKTGDIVCIEKQTNLKIIGQCQKIFQLAQGEYISPQKLETTYLRDSEISDIFVYGQSLLSYLIAIVVPQQMFLRRICKENGISEENAGQNIIVQQILLECLIKRAEIEGLSHIQIIRDIIVETDIDSKFQTKNFVMASNSDRDQILDKYKPFIEKLYNFPH